jgi:hypothetical protein
MMKKYFDHSRYTYETKSDINNFDFRKAIILLFIFPKQIFCRKSHPINIRFGGGCDVAP